MYMAHCAVIFAIAQLSCIAVFLSCFVEYFLCLCPELFCVLLYVHHVIANFSKSMRVKDFLNESVYD